MFVKRTFKIARFVTQKNNAFCSWDSTDNMTPYYLLFNVCRTKDNNGTKQDVSQIPKFYTAVHF